jgi:hypothetical protein
MTYRDEESELARRRALITERATLDDDDRIQALDDEVARIDEARHDALKKRLPMVANARIASPCPETWDSMSGGDAVRQCTRCDKEVFDLSALTLAGAEALLTSRVGQRTCARLFVRPDGTMLFADCIVGKRGVRMRRAMIAGAGVLMAATAFAMAEATPPPPAPAHCRTHVHATAITTAPELVLPPEPEHGFEEIDGEMVMGEMPIERMGEM